MELVHLKNYVHNVKLAFIIISYKAPELPVLPYQKVYTTFRAINISRILSILTEQPLRIQ